MVIDQSFQSKLLKKSVTKTPSTIPKKDIMQENLLKKITGFFFGRIQSKMFLSIHP